MKPRSPDPLTLARKGLALHQSLTVSAHPEAWREALSRSPLFTIESSAIGLRAAWIAPSPEDDPLPFPLGLVSICSGGILLEGFSEERLRTLRCRVQGLGCGSVDADQQRVMPLAEALAAPTRLLQPLHDQSGEPLERREIAQTFLRLGWPFIPRDDLAGRAPYVAVGTGRGRAALEGILENVIDEILEWLPGFPSLDPEDLKAILIPQGQTSFPSSAVGDAASTSGTRPD